MPPEPSDTAGSGAPTPRDLEQLVREILASENLLSTDAATLPADADLRDAGLTSLRMVQLVLAIEERCDTMIPDESLSRSRFADIDAVAALVQEVLTSTPQPPAPSA